MEEKKVQKIIVFITFSPGDGNLILNGVKLASIFRKELCLACLAKKKKDEEIRFLKQKLKQYILPLSGEIPELKTSVLVLRESIRLIPQVLADDYEAILLVADSAQYKTYAKAVTYSPVPFLFVSTKAPLSSFKKIVLPVDLRKENSDSALWCSWFGKFNRSEITAIAANDKNSESQKLVTRNIMHAKMLFQKLNVSHKIYKGTKNSLQNSFEAMEYARANGSDMLVLPGSSVITPLDLVIGLPERKIIRDSDDIPVLLVNPRRDNYILCD